MHSRSNPNAPPILGDNCAGASTGNADPSVGVLVRRLRQELKRRSTRDDEAVAGAFAEGKAHFAERFMEITDGEFPDDISSPAFAAFFGKLRRAKQLADEIDRTKNVLFDRQQALMVERMKREQGEDELGKTRDELVRLHSDYDVLYQDYDADATANQPGLVAVDGDGSALPLLVTRETNPSRGNKLQYTTACISGVAAFVRTHRLSGQVARILHSALAFWIQKPIEYCALNFPLPKPTQQKVHTRMMGALGQQQHMARLKEAPLFSLSADEAPIHRIKTFSVLATDC